MRRFRNCVLALLLGMCAPVLIWVGAFGALSIKRKQSKLMDETIPNMNCSLDGDCPPGFVCMDGRCIPETALR